MKYFSFILIAMLIASIGFSQDIITQKNGDNLVVKILEITPTEVKYKNIDEEDGPLFIIYKSEISSIQYKNGNKVVFSNTVAPSANTSGASTTSTIDENVDLCTQAAKDAKRFYKAQNVGAGGTIATNIILSPLFGLIPAAICSSVEPREKNLNSPSPKLLDNPNYNNCYKKEAYKAKKKKIWISYGISSGLWLILFLAL